MSYFAPLDESSQELVLHQNNSIGKSIELIRDAKEVQGEPCAVAKLAASPLDRKRPAPALKSEKLKS